MTPAAAVGVAGVAVAAAAADPAADVRTATAAAAAAASPASSAADQPPPFGSKRAAGLYTPSGPWLTDVFLDSTAKERA
jgi:hypothetical protein